MAKSEAEKNNNKIPKIPNIKDIIAKTEKKGGGEVLPHEKNILNMAGGIATVTTIPTGAPKKFSDSIIIYLDSLSAPTTKRLYVFSREGDAWFYVGLT